MKKSFTVLISCFIIQCLCFCTSVYEPTPEDLAKKCVNDFFQAVRTSDSLTIDSLFPTFDKLSACHITSDSINISSIIPNPKDSLQFTVTLTNYYCVAYDENNIQKHKIVLELQPDTTDTIKNKYIIRDSKGFILPKMLRPIDYKSGTIDSTDFDLFDSEIIRRMEIVDTLRLLLIKKTKKQIENNIEAYRVGDDKVNHSTGKIRQDVNIRNNSGYKINHLIFKGRVLFEHLSVSGGMHVYRDNTTHSPWSYYELHNVFEYGNDDYATLELPYNNPGDGWYPVVMQGSFEVPELEAERVMKWTGHEFEDYCKENNISF